MNVIRVIATGRSLYSANKVLDENLPIDYLLFSSGAGILKWRDKKIIKDAALNSDEIKYINNYLLDLNADFMLHQPIPDNHQFCYHDNGNHNPDFDKRLQFYSEFSCSFKENNFNYKSACQYVVIIPDHSINYESIANDLNKFSVIRTTSPLDKKTLWIEIFPANVSKSYSASWLCNRLGLDKSCVLSIGNDYNDLDLLEWAGQSYVVENAPDDLKQKFKLTKSNHESAFMHAVSDVISI
jgi:HAD superfamily hydrolase (TIGR01484 family)